MLAALGAHDLARRFETLNDPWVSPQLMLFGAAGLFIAHHLVEGADAERRFIAPFPRYFEIASEETLKKQLLALRLPLREDASLMRRSPRRAARARAGGPGPCSG